MAFVKMVQGDYLNSDAVENLIRYIHRGACMLPEKERMFESMGCFSDEPDDVIENMMNKPVSTADVFCPMLADCSTYGEDLQFVLDFGESIGVPREELEYLWESGFDVDEIELAAQDRHHRMMCLLCAGYYDEMEGNENGYDPFEDLPWAEA